MKMDFQLQARQNENHLQAHGEQIGAAGGQRLGLLKGLVHSCCFLTLELMVLLAFLSISIGLTTLLANTDEKILKMNLSVYFHTYVSLSILYFFATLQAKYQLKYMVPQRGRFGIQANFCFDCNFPCSIFFVVLLLAYVSLCYFVSRLACSIGSNEAKHVDPSSPDWESLNFTTAVVMFSISLIQYLTCRKFKWDTYFEKKRLNYQRQRDTECTFELCSGLIFGFIQVILTVMYLMPTMLWLGICSSYRIDLLVTVPVVVLIAGVLGFLATIIEPFPLVQNLQMYFINLNVRRYLMCFLYIPCLAYWYYRMDGACPLTFGGKRGSQEFKNFHLFLLNVSACIINTVKYTRLTCMAIKGQRQQPLLHQRRPFDQLHRVNFNQVAPLEQAPEAQVPPAPSEEFAVPPPSDFYYVEDNDEVPAQPPQQHNSEQNRHDEVFEPVNQADYEAAGASYGRANVVHEMTSSRTIKGSVAADTTILDFAKKDSSDLANESKIKGV